MRLFDTSNSLLLLFDKTLFLDSLSRAYVRTRLFSTFLILLFIVSSEFSRSQNAFLFPLIFLVFCIFHFFREKRVLHISETVLFPIFFLILISLMSSRFCTNWTEEKQGSAILLHYTLSIWERRLLKVRACMLHRYALYFLRLKKHDVDTPKSALCSAFRYFSW